MDFWVERIIGMYTIKNTFYGGVLNDKKYGLGRKVCWIVCNFLEGHQYWKRTILCIHFYPYRYAGNSFKMISITNYIQKIDFE